jgi:2-polyprenyl-3-methyl-5-hydroxy-6-metoxy-1,4-benzoquinol methylase
VPPATATAAPSTAARGRCPACLEAASREAFAVRGYRFLRCARCRSLFVADPPADEPAHLYAGEDYFRNPDFDDAEGGGFHGYRDYLADREHNEDKFGLVLDHLEALGAGGRLLDVGAGPGLLVRVARERGWDAVGIDVNPWATEYARELGVEVQPVALEDAALEPGSFDAVTLLDVLEHVSRPDELLARVVEVLKPNGTVALLTPDAGSPVSRALGARWPEAKRVPEHLVLFSVRGLAALLARHGLEPVGWHPIGKRSTLATLAADVAPAAPALGPALGRLVERSPLAGVVVDLDPRTKFCVYARRTDAAVAAASPGRLPKRLRPVAAEEAVLEDLGKLARAGRLADWMATRLQAIGAGSVVEVGAGIGTFTERLLAGGASRVLAVEPDAECSAALEWRFAGDARVRIVREALPAGPALAAERDAHDLVLCQNVLEHIDDDAGAVAEMASLLRPGGTLALLLPAHPRLFGSLDLAYGHRRRYTRRRAAALVRAAGLEPVELSSFNLPGVAGWWASNRRGSVSLGSRPLAVFDALVPLWRPLEDRLRPRWGLSVVVRARRPA